VKENPEMVEAIITDWKKDEVGKSTAWIIKHGERSK
jgi:3-methyladenine DNA glycosylase AlkC